MSDEVNRVVFSAWAAALVNEPFEENRPMSETSIDSLRGMTMVLEIESRLGLRLSADLIHPDATPRSIAEGLARGGGGAGDRAPAFIFSGFAGEDEMAARVRRALGTLLAFTSVPPPDPANLQAPPDLVGAGVTVGDDVARLQPEGRLILVGYSYGGALAVEAARHLIRSGRAVEILVLLDVVPVRRPLQRLGDIARSPATALSKARRRLATFQRLRPGIGGLVIDVAFTLSAYGLVGKLSGRSSGVDELYSAGRMQAWEWRVASLRRWRPEPLNVRALLVATDDNLFSGGPRFWRRLVPNLSILHVAGGHRDLARPEALAAIHAAVKTALGR